MAGRGPAPKDPRRRARRNADTINTTMLRFDPGTQPELPVSFDAAGELIPWPEATIRWWKAWGDSAMAETFTDLDWSFLLDTALLHAAMWRGDQKAASELRLRVAKFGQTPEDRARLRIQFATADEADDKRDRKRSARDRYSPTIVPLPGVVENA